MNKKVILILLLLILIGSVYLSNYKLKTEKNLNEPRWAKIFVENPRSIEEVTRNPKIKGVIVETGNQFDEAKENGLVVYCMISTGNLSMFYTCYEFGCQPTYKNVTDEIKSGRAYSHLIDETKYRAERGCDGIIFDEEIAFIEMNVSQFNDLRELAKRINPNILVGLVEYRTDVFVDFLNSGAKPDFIQGEWYSNHQKNNFTELKELASDYNIKSAYWVVGSNNSEGLKSTLNYSNKTYEELDGIIFFESGRYWDEVEKIVNSFD